MAFKDLLATEFAPFGALSEVQLTALERHYNLLMRWNQRMNLTRIVELHEVVQLHYCECLWVGQTLPAGDLRVVDVGSGAGFPGIPVAVIRPEFKVDLAESHQRKSVFLRDASAELANVRVVAERAEALDAHYDWIISRAVRPSDVLTLRLAKRTAMLMSDKDLNETILKPTSVLEVPWGKGRILAIFNA